MPCCAIWTCSSPCPTRSWNPRCAARSPAGWKPAPWSTTSAQRRAFFVLLSGCLKVAQVTPEGGQVVVRYVNPGDLFGLACAMRQPRYPPPCWRCRKRLPGLARCALGALHQPSSATGVAGPADHGPAVAGRASAHPGAVQRRSRATWRAPSCGWWTAPGNPPPTASASPSRSRARTSPK
ncbi:cyclic nucleotide-binding domain-containing protein [Achromobacter insuavis]